MHEFAIFFNGDFNNLRSFVISVGPFGPLAIVALMVLHTILPFPAEVVTLIAGALYGPWLGLLFTWIGAMIGGITGFGLMRWIGHPILNRFLPPKAKEFSKRLVGENAAISLLLLRLLPFVSFNLINYAAGLSEVDFGTFLWTMAVGILPLSILLTFMGKEAAHGSFVFLILLSLLILLVWTGHHLKRTISKKQ